MSQRGYITYLDPPGRLDSLYPPVECLGWISCINCLSSTAQSVMVVRHTWHSSIPLALVWFDQQELCLYLQSRHCQIVWYLCRICTYIPVLCPLSFSVWVSLFSFSQLRGSVPFALHWCSGTGVEYMHVSLLEVWISVATDVNFTSSYEWKVYRRIVKKKKGFRLSQLKFEVRAFSDLWFSPIS